MRNVTLAAATLAGALLLAGCAGSGPASPAVPTAAQGGGAPAGQDAAGRAAALHAAAQCIRQHGIPSYADPVLASGGRVYSDSRSIEDAPEGTINARGRPRRRSWSRPASGRPRACARTACRTSTTRRRNRATRRGTGSG